MRFEKVRENIRILDKNLLLIPSPSPLFWSVSFGGKDADGLVEKLGKNLPRPLCSAGAVGGVGFRVIYGLRAGVEAATIGVEFVGWSVGRGL